MLGAYIQSNCPRPARELFATMMVRDTASWIAASTQRGNLLQAGKIFSTLPDRSIVPWNAMIHGCAQNGHAEFLTAWRWRNEISFQAILLTCGSSEWHSTTFDLWWPSTAFLHVIHFQAMADVLGRAGLVAEAEGLLLAMPF
ncbi:pentatricopeptide repeat-containing protein At2g44880-like [Selaginella moellendorffii]|uniref:pentatricopeptide repeat-containing protein At2g44880-like n=1 Tax=Selaginella moellendorffii TaxID=88036 RepID=UPI000D1CEE58|nr:pentatricopeptide repeat-containing protein At2g44880-like [Selaginella moellendorffii]|eukprot:XP_024527116.1 pentatricopeptide repeat-containing protein At2g44880-like [Selaginella moellendorffii]